MACDVSIIIPVLNKLEFTRQCLDRIARNTGEAISYEIIVIDNASTDGTAEWFAGVDHDAARHRVRYERNTTNLGFAKANNVGARLSQSSYLLFLNNDTIVTPGWLSEMVRIVRADRSVGIVGIKQLFPYTNSIYHTGIVFAPGGKPEHLYPHLDASLTKVNKQREYQAVTGACLLIERALFDECGGFDEEYRNGYEDIELCMQVRQRRRKVVCCTSAYIYHYGQISEGRTADDDQNAALFLQRWSKQVKADRDDYLIRDRADDDRPARPGRSRVGSLADDCIYLADDLGQGSALTWINAELALTLKERGVPVFVNGSATLSTTVDAAVRRKLSSSLLTEPPVGGTQIKWSHYWPRHLNLELTGSSNLEFFVINYLFGQPGSEPWDFWLQCVRQNGYDKLPLSEFCQDVLRQIGLSQHQSHVWYPGYSREIDDVEASARRSSAFRFLTVSNSHDLERYNTLAVLEAFRRAFTAQDDVVLVIKDYGASSGDRTLRNAVAGFERGPRIEYVSEFTDKRELIRLYKSCDAFVSAHRGEGFGMKILDAMACGLPVITPLFGGPTAYCEPGNTMAVDFSLVPMGNCLDTRSLRITNAPTWAEVDIESLKAQMRRAHDDRTFSSAIGARGRDSVVSRFSWGAAATRLIDITRGLQAARESRASPRADVEVARAERSPYWLGLRVTVVVPTFNRKDKLLSCLDALARQSILPQEFEVVLIDDGSTDGTREALQDRHFPFGLRYYRQENAGPGQARNMGIQRARGEIVLFIGDDIMADERLLEEHLLAHAGTSEPGAAVLGHIDWPQGMTPNGVMDYVCGDGKLQFAYSVIPKLPTLDHRFFYTSNISLERQFLVDAADSGIRFDPSFRRAAFEDSEFAFRLLPRGLRIRYVPEARATHDHWMDLDSFARREFGAGEMAVAFYRKHPGLDDLLKVEWMADFVEPAKALLERPDVLGHLESFDRQTDTLLRSLAAALEELMALERRPGASASVSLSADRLRAALNNVLRLVFDVERTRGKLQEWFSTVDDPVKVRTAQTLASVIRKVESLSGDHPVGLQGLVAPFDSRAVAGLSGRLAEIPGLSDRMTSHRSVPARVRRRVLRLIAAPAILSRLIAADRFIESRLQSETRASWLTNYRRVRSRIRRGLL